MVKTSIRDYKSEHREEADLVIVQEESEPIEEAQIEPARSTSSETKKNDAGGQVDRLPEPDKPPNATRRTKTLYERSQPPQGF